MSISDLEMDLELYPRIKTNWMTAYQYRIAMEIGDKFPPVVVGEHEGKMHLLDGWHRVTALKSLKRDTVKARVQPYETREEMFLDAIRMNSTHGQRLSVQEKVRLIHKLTEMGLTPQRITDLVKVSTNRLKDFRERVATDALGNTIFLKALTYKTAGVENAGMVNQDLFNVRDISAILSQLLEILEKSVFPTSDKDAMDLAIRVYESLGGYIEIAIKGR